MRNSPFVNWLSRRAVSREDDVLAKAESESGETQGPGIKAKQNRVRVLELHDEINELVDAWDTYPEERINNGIKITYLVGELSRLEGWA